MKNLLNNSEPIFASDFSIKFVKFCYFDFKIELVNFRFHESSFSFWDIFLWFSIEFQSQISRLAAHPTFISFRPRCLEFEFEMKNYSLAAKIFSSWQNAFASEAASDRKAQEREKKLKNSPRFQFRVENISECRDSVEINSIFSSRLACSSLLAAISLPVDQLKLITLH